MIQIPSLKKIRDILKTSTTIAVVGLSPKPDRPSHQVAQYMLRQGYRIIPVNPGHNELLGQPCYPDILSVPESVDIVNIFRRAEQVPPIVQEAIASKVKVIWMQEGIVNEMAAKLAEKNRIEVIMNRCIMLDHQLCFSRPDVK